MSLALRHESDSIQVGVIQAIPFFAPISVSGNGDNQVLAGIAGKQIRVLEYALVCNAAVVVTWKSSAAGAISGPMSFAQNGGIEASFSPVGKMQTAVGEGLVLSLSGAVSVGGYLMYIKV